MEKQYKRQEIIDLFKANEENISGILNTKLQLIIVGGFAFTAHLKQRLTHDVDFVNNLNEDEQIALNMLIEKTGLSINNRAANKRSYGDVYSFTEEYIDESKTIELNNIILKSPKLEYLIASKFFDNRPDNEDANQIGYSTTYIDKELLEEIVKKIIGQNNVLINNYYRENKLKIIDFYRSKGWDQNDIPNA